MNRQSSIVNRKSIGAGALKYLVGGVNSPVRAFRHVGGNPLMLRQGRDSQVYDVDGRAYVDFIMGWGSLIHGHRQVKGSTVLGLTHPAEAELARLMVDAVPSVEQVRFTVSGTEACMTAVRLARAVTGRPRILMFDGSYHGHAESVMAGKTAGISAAATREAMSVPYNDIEAVARAIRHHANRFACVIVEPVAANTGVIVPEVAFLKRLRALTQRHGILLIFDEVVTGFRLALGGAQSYFRITPDLTTFGKIIGGGMPIGALGGPARFMKRLAPEGNVYHGGTFAGHPLSMTAGAFTLKKLHAHPPYGALDRAGRRLQRGLQHAAQRCGIAIQINRLGSMLTVFFSDQPIRNAGDAARSRRQQFAAWANGLRRHGILIPPSPFEALFLSTAHTAQDVDRLITASEEIFTAMGNGA
ncbi:MAG: glutamate-1-semialdehyde 2,1-aminomutase [Candidatus Omnitrophica bacterium]|nr:glutamate-1-semialdehyde 2,1-aminomutase [Candidatus Omnitrophota bacterium]